MRRGHHKNINNSLIKNNKIKILHFITRFLCNIMLLIFLMIRFTFCFLAKDTLNEAF